MVMMKRWFMHPRLSAQRRESVLFEVHKKLHLMLRARQTERIVRARVVEGRVSTVIAHVVNVPSSSELTAVGFSPHLPISRHAKDCILCTIIKRVPRGLIHSDVVPQPDGSLMEYSLLGGCSRCGEVRELYPWL